MGSRWLSRLAIAAGAAGVLTMVAATSALAVTTIPINPGNVPTTAKQFEDPQKRDGDCKDILDNLPEAPAAVAEDDLLIDGWHFVLPGGTGDFAEIRLMFKRSDNTQVQVTVEGGSIDPLWFGAFKQTGSGQVKHAYLITEAGWTLVDGEADVTGTADKFNLSHKCAGIGDETPPPGNGSSTPPNNGTGTGTAPGGGGSLPITGAAVGSFVVVGIGLVAAGVALMAVRRRRDISDLTEI